MVSRVPIILIALFMTAGLCRYFDKPFDPHLIEEARKAPFDRNAAEQDLAFMTDEAHPFGSPRQKAIADHIVERLRAQGFKDASLQIVDAQTPNPRALAAQGAPVNATVAVSGQNVVVGTSSLFKSKPSCAVVVASHYDSKVVDGVSYVGANDSGSSSIALMALLPMARDMISRFHPQCEIIAVWFDGEESILSAWTSGEREHPAHSVDHTYGSRFLAGQLTPCPTSPKSLCLPDALGSGRLVALILLDMIGSPHIALTREVNSSTALAALLSAADKALLPESILSEASVPVEDDHIPFKERAIPVLDIVDFNHLQFWHRPGDTIANIAPDSIEKVVRLSLLMSMAIAIHPELADTTGAFAP